MQQSHHMNTRGLQNSRMYDVHCTIVKHTGYVDTQLQCCNAIAKGQQHN
jgi:hypothetical protein